MDTYLYLSRSVIALLIVVGTLRVPSFNNSSRILTSLLLIVVDTLKERHTEYIYTTIRSKNGTRSVPTTIKSERTALRVYIYYDTLKERHTECAYYY